MITAERKKEAQQNFAQYLKDRLIKKEKNEAARAMYVKNADLSLNLAEECMNSNLKPYNLGCCHLLLFHVLYGKCCST